MEHGFEVVVWLGLGLGLLGVLGARAGPARPRAGGGTGRDLLVLAAMGALLALLAYLATLGESFPFQQGQRLGHGFLLGGAAGLLVLLIADARHADAAGLVTAAGGSALAAISAALLLDRGYPNPAVAGVPFGMGAAVLFAAARGQDAGLRIQVSGDDGRRTTDDESRTANTHFSPELHMVARAAAYGFLVATALGAATLLAISRYEEMPRAVRLAAGEKLWWGMPVALGGAAILGQLAGNFLGRRPLLGALAPGGLALAVVAVLLFLVHGRGALAAPNGWGAYGWLLLPFAAGWISALLLGAGSGRGGEERRGERGAGEGEPGSALSSGVTIAPSPARPIAPSPGREPAALLGLLIVIALLAAAYRAPAGALASTRTAATGTSKAYSTYRPAISDEGPSNSGPATPTLSGYGVSLAALGFLLAGPWFLGGGLNGNGSRGVERIRPATAFLAAGTLLVVAAAFRVFYDRYDLDESGIRLAPHYTLLGIMAGAGAPIALAIAARAVTGACVRSSALRGAVTGGIAALLPALLVIFWGIRAGGGLLVGLAAGLGFMLLLALLEPPAEDKGTGGIATALPVIPVVMVALVALLALTPLDFYATHWPRALRIALTAAGALGIGGWSIAGLKRWRS